MRKVAPATLISFSAASEKLFGRNVGRLASMPDLEDAVPEAEKPAARRTLARLLAAHPCAPTRELDELVFPRVNALGTRHFADDLQALMAEAANGFHGVVVPKLQDAGEVEKILGTLREYADRHAWTSVPELIALIESVRGIENVAAICDALARSESGGVLCGHLDLASDARLVVTNPVERHRELREWTKLVARTANSRGLCAIDGPFPKLGAGTEDELALTTRWSLVDGYDGRLVIHPSQVDVVRSLLIPSAEAAREALRMLRRARDHGGAFRDEQSGEMIDNAVRRSHWTLVERALANGVIGSGEAEGLEPPPP